MLFTLPQWFRMRPDPPGGVPLYYTADAGGIQPFFGAFRKDKLFRSFYPPGFARDPFFGLSPS